MGGDGMQLVKYRPTISIRNEGTVATQREIGESCRMKKAIWVHPYADIRLQHPRSRIASLGAIPWPEVIVFKGQRWLCG